jgi:hypothetical protein
MDQYYELDAGELFLLYLGGVLLLGTVILCLVLRHGRSSGPIESRRPGDSGFTESAAQRCPLRRMPTVMIREFPPSRSGLTTKPPDGDNS